MTQCHFEHLVSRLSQLQPAFRLQGEWLQRPHEWQRQWRARLLDLLGQWPRQCSPDTRWEQLETRSAYSLHRVTYATEPGLETFALVAIPHGLDRPTAGVLAIHGHGPLGAYPVLNWGDDHRLPQQVTSLRYDFGHRIARRGIVVFAPNLRGFGTRLTEREHQAQSSRDTCNVNFFQQMLIGEVAITGQLHDLRAAIGILLAMPQVDEHRLACAGLSYGGRLATFLAALEPRMKATVVAGALDSFVQRVESYATCGFQIVPGMLRYGDTAEVMGLTAPGSLGIELGDEDGCAPVDQGLREFDRLQALYQAMGAGDSLRLFRYTGGHIFHGEQSIQWLVEQLR